MPWLCKLVSLLSKMVMLLPCFAESGFDVPHPVLVLSRGLLSHHNAQTAETHFVLALKRTQQISFIRHLSFAQIADFEPGTESSVPTPKMEYLRHLEQIFFRYFKEDLLENL